MQGRIVRLSLAAALGLMAAPAAQAADMSAQMLSDACAGCHGTDARSPGSIPGFADKKPEVIKKALLEYKTGAKEATIMDRITKGYSDAQIEAIAMYLGTK